MGRLGESNPGPTHYQLRAKRPGWVSAALAGPCWLRGILSCAGPWLLDWLLDPNPLISFGSAGRGAFRSCRASTVAIAGGWSSAMVTATYPCDTFG
jgi:hypothetical protein